MSSTVAWLLFVLGAAHIAHGAIKFKTPLTDAVRAGFVGRFGMPEARRTAFWFVMFGPLLMLAGHVSIHAAAAGDVQLVRIVGAYLLGLTIVGVLALPKSPFLAGLAVAILLLASSYGLI